jgi:hypothetical protein
MLRKSLKWSLIYGLEALALVLALAIFGVGAALWRLSSGPVTLDYFRNDAETMLRQAFDGDLVSLGQLEARFDPDARTLVVLARDVAVAEANGEVIARAPLIEAGLAVDSLLFGRIEPVQVNIVGGSVSVVRRADGAVGAGLGNVDRVALSARPPARGGDDSAALFQLLENPARSGGLLGRLRQLRIENAAVRLVDEISGIAWLVDDAGVTLDRDESRILAEIDGRVATSAGYAPLSIRLEAGASLNSLLLEARAENLALSAVAPDNGPASALQALDAPLSFDLVVNALRDTGIRTASLDLFVGDGEIMQAGESTVFNGAALRASFDPIEGQLRIYEGRIDSELISASVTGLLSDIGQYVGVLPTRWRFDLDFGAGFVDMGPVFERPPRWAGFAVEGLIDVAERRAELDQLVADLGPVIARLSGDASLTQSEDGRWLPNLRLSGPIEGDVQPDLVLSYWPVDLAEGAREWIGQGILGGRFYNAQFALDLEADSVLAGRLPNDKMSLSFDYEDARVRYISTMSEITGARGSAVLRGNAFEARLDSGQIGDIEVYGGVVDMPRLNPKGATATYSGFARGRATDLLQLIDEEPLGFPTAYGVDPTLIGGEGVVRFEIQRAMLSDVDPDDILFQIIGDFEGVNQVIPGTDLELVDGVVHIEADQNTLMAQGDATLLDAPVHIEWEEDFRAAEDLPSTTFTIAAELGARTLDRFGVPARRFLTGTVGIEARARSNGLEIASIDIDADLTNAALEAPGGVWFKDVGTPGSAGLTLSTNEQGNFLLEEVVASAAGLAIEAAAEIAPGGRLVEADIHTVHIDDFVDISGRLAAPSEPGNPFIARLTGSYLDAREIIPNLLAANAQTEEAGSDDPGTEAASAEDASAGADATGEDRNVPLSLTLDLGRLVAADDTILDDFSVIWRGEEAGVRAFSVAGNSPDGPFHASFGAPVEGAAREFRVEAQSAQRLLALFGQSTYIRGGQLSVLGEAPPLGVDGPLTARVEVDQLTLVGVPVLARILAAGSFDGLSRLLSGQGISFDRVDADIMFEDGLLTIGEARAAGESLGVTAAGTVDFDARTAAIDGNLAPSYVLNSLFGELPVIGELLVSRPGEGIIGITYSVEGPFDALTVFANPLSAFAPGVLRRIFEGTAASRAARDRADEMDAPVEEMENAAPEGPDDPAATQPQDDETPDPAAAGQSPSADDGEPID